METLFLLLGLFWVIFIFQNLNSVLHGNSLYAQPLIPGGKPTSIPVQCIMLLVWPLTLVFIVLWSLGLVEYYKRDARKRNKEIQLLVETEIKQLKRD